MEKSSTESTPPDDAKIDTGNKIGLLKKLGWPKTVLILTTANGPVVGINSAHLFVRILYMTEELNMSKQRALLLAHGSQGLKVVGGIIAGIIADSFTGKYLVLAISYVIQACVSVLYGLSMVSVKWVYIVALLLENAAMFGQPLLSIFVPEQFDEDDQARKLQVYYTYDYVYLNFSAIFWALILIEIANEYSCMSSSKCYSVIFFPYTVSISIYAVIFISMKKLYKMNLPTRTVIRDVIACLFVPKRENQTSQTTIQNWAERRCDVEFKNDVLQVKRLALITSLSFLFYLVLYQIETTFIYQASYLDGSFGDKWIMKPAHAEIINPVSVIIFAPLLQHLIFPRFDKWGVLNTPLQKIGTSYLLASAAFFMAGILQKFINSNEVGNTDEDDAQLRFYNAMSSAIKISGNVTGEMIVTGWLSVMKSVSFEKTIERFEVEVSDASGEFLWKGEIEAVKGRSVAYIFRRKNFVRVAGELVIGKTKSLRPSVVVYCGEIACSGTLALKNVKNGVVSERVSFPNNSTYSASVEVPYVGWFELLVNDTTFETFEFKDGGMYSLLLMGEPANFTVAKFTLRSPNSIHILWIFPQIIVMTLAEIFQFIPSSLFVFTQSPPCMRSFVRVIQTSFISLAHLTIASLNQIEMEDTLWFFLLSGFVLLAAVLHLCLSVKYVYLVNHG